MTTRELINSMLEHQRQTLIELRTTTVLMEIPSDIYEQLRSNILSNIAGLEHLRGRIPREEE